MKSKIRSAVAAVVLASVVSLLAARAWTADGSVSDREVEEVEVDRTWKFAGWTEDRAVFTRTIKDSRGEELQESTGVSSPFTSDVG